MVAQTIGQQMNPPGGLVQTAPPQNETDFATRQKSWLDYFANPQVQAGLMQFGVSLMTPMGHLQSSAGHVGAAMADAGGAIGRVGAAQTAEQDRQLAQQQQQTENTQRDRQIAATERGTDAQIAATKAKTVIDEKNLDLEERKLYEYLIPLAKQNAAGGASGDKLRNTLISAALTNIMKEQAGWGAISDDPFPMDERIQGAMVAIDKLMGGSAAAADAPAVPEGADGASTEPPPGSPPEAFVSFVEQNFTADEIAAQLSNTAQRQIWIQELGPQAVVALDKKYRIKNESVQQAPQGFNNLTPGQTEQSGAATFVPPKPGQVWDPKTKTWVDPKVK